MSTENQVLEKSLNSVAEADGQNVMTTPEKLKNGVVDQTDNNEAPIIDKPIVKEEQPTEVTAMDEEILLQKDSSMPEPINKEDDALKMEVKPVSSENIPKSNETGNTDPFAYVDHGDFTSEKFKIEVRGMPRFFGLGELKKLVNDTLKLGSNKIKPPRQGSHVFICFRSEENKQLALAALNGLTWKNSKLLAIPAKPAPDPLVRKRKQEAEKEGSKAKIAKCTLPPAEKMKKNTTPLWDTPYEKQLEIKTASVRKSLKQLGHLLGRGNPGLLGWLKERQDKYNGLPCELMPIRPSPQVDGYRNKCEFTIGIHPETSKPSVGFRLGSYSSGEIGVFPADDLRHIPDRLKQIAKGFEKFVTDSNHPPFSPESKTGCWQTLSVRLTRLGQVMVMVTAHLDRSDEAGLQKFKDNLKNYFEVGAGAEFKINSLYFHAYVKKQPNVSIPPPVLLMGDAYVTEELLGLKLRISPQAFFQVNTLAAEELYTAVSELAHLTPDTTLLDICCGTGSIGLCLAKDCGQVLGIELVPPAVEDAKANAAANELSHCDFFMGQAETLLSSVLVRATRPNVMAVLDPPRPGIGAKLIHTVRKSQELKKMVYMACSPQAAQRNFLDLGRPASKTICGHPFLPVCAIPVDMFPHTNHCELVVLFERVDPSTFPPPPPRDTSEIANKQAQNGQGRTVKKNGHPVGGKSGETDFTSAQGPGSSAPGTSQAKLGLKRRGRNKRPGFTASTVQGSVNTFPRNQSVLSVAAKGISRAARRNLTTSSRGGQGYIAKPYQMDTSLRIMVGRGRGVGPLRASLGLDKRMQRGIPGQRGSSWQRSGPGMRNSPGQVRSYQHLEAAKELGRNWGRQLTQEVLSDEEMLRRQQDEALEKFKEGFSAVIQHRHHDETFRRPRDPPMNRHMNRYNRGGAHSSNINYGRFEEMSPPTPSMQYPSNRAYRGIQPVNRNDEVLLRRGFSDREEMIPESVVSKLLDDCRREMEVRTLALETQRLNEVVNASRLLQNNIVPHPDMDNYGPREVIRDCDPFSGRPSREVLYRDEQFSSTQERPEYMLRDAPKQPFYDNQSRSPRRKANIPSLASAQPQMNPVPPTVTLIEGEQGNARNNQQNESMEDKRQSRNRRRINKNQQPMWQRRTASNEGSTNSYIQPEIQPQSQKPPQRSSSTHFSYGMQRNLNMEHPVESTRASSLSRMPVQSWKKPHSFEREAPSFYQQQSSNFQTSPAKEQQRQASYVNKNPIANKQQDFGSNELKTSPRDYARHGFQNQGGRNYESRNSEPSGSYQNQSRGGYQSRTNDYHTYETRNSLPQSGQPFDAAKNTSPKFYGSRNFSTNNQYESQSRESRFQSANPMSQGYGSEMRGFSSRANPSNFNMAPSNMWSNQAPNNSSWDNQQANNMMSILPSNQASSGNNTWRFK